MKRLLLVPLLATLLAWPGADARAAESYDSCTGFIDTLPAVIAAQGTWCLRKDLATPLATGQAITVNTSNVTLDCNRFKLGGLAAGAATNTVGVRAENRANVTVRGCNLRGFLIGVQFFGENSSGHVVEDNLFDGMTYQGISVEGDGSVVRRNRVLDTGGSTLVDDYAYGISARGGVEVSDNIVAGVAAIGNEGGVAFAFGIRLDTAQGVPVRGNQVRGLAVGPGGGNAFGVYLFDAHYIDIVDNLLAGPVTFGVDCDDASSIARGNVITQATVLPVNFCTASGNLP